MYEYSNRRGSMDRMRYSNTNANIDWPYGMDPEMERPTGYTEFVSGEQSWREVGIRIKWTQPRTPGPINLRASMEMPIKLMVCVETKEEIDVPPDNLTAWCWTPIITVSNKWGIWKEIELEYNPRCTQWDDCGIRTYVFVGNVQATKEDVYRVTFNIKWKNYMIWSNHFQEDNMADIEMNPSVGTQTYRNPMVHFTSNFSEGQTDKCLDSSDIKRPAKLTLRNMDFDDDWETETRNKKRTRASYAQREEEMDLIMY